MDKIFDFLWAAICAWGIVWLLGKYGAEWPVISSTADFVNGWGLWSAKKILFIVVLVIIHVTGLHKYIGHTLCLLIGVAGIVLLAGVILLVLYFFLNWLMSTL